MTSIAVRPMSRRDVPEVARLHRASFPNFFASRLGERFLHDLYGEAVGNGEPAHVALDGSGDVAGFVKGSAAEGSLFRSLAIHRFPSLALVSLGAIARSPGLVNRVARAAMKAPRGVVRPGTATLMFIAVGANLQGRGAAKTLLRQFIDDLARRGVMRVELVTL